MVRPQMIEFEFLAWMEFQDPLGDPPSSYWVQLRQEGDHDWQTVHEIPGDQTGNVTVNLDVTLVSESTYHLRVVPVLVYEGEAYEGTAPEVSFYSSSQDSDDSTLIIAIVIPLLLLMLIVAVILLW